MVLIVACWDALVVWFTGECECWAVWRCIWFGYLGLLYYRLVVFACFGARWWYGLASLVGFLGLGLLLVWVRLLQAAVVLGDLVIACGMCLGLLFVFIVFGRLVGVLRLCSRLRLIGLV